MLFLTNLKYALMPSGSKIIFFLKKTTTLDISDIQMTVFNPADKLATFLVNSHPETSASF